MNDYDSDRMADVLACAGMERTGRPEEAGVILLNTCSVREKAQERLFDELGRMRAHKERDPGVRIGVGGCVASQEGGRIVGRAPYVDLVFGPQAIHRLPGMLERREATRRPQVDLTFDAVEKFDELPPVGARGARAFVSVMEGCSKYCTFCVVPYTRGREVSRPVADVLDEVADLALGGARDVTLLGQNVNAYMGREPGGTASLARLVECVSHIDGIDRIRYTTSHPVNFTDDLVAAHAGVAKLMPHVHLPVQSGDDRVLARMKRGHTLLEYKQVIRKLRKAHQGISITSDFIVGFPGETEGQFERTVDLARWARFDGGFSFVYSARPGTPAASYGGQVPPDEGKRRLRRLQGVLDATARESAARYVGTRQQVLVEGETRRGDALLGRLPDNRTASCAGKARVGELREVRVTAARGAALAAEFLP